VVYLAENDDNDKVDNGSGDGSDESRVSFSGAETQSVQSGHNRQTIDDYSEQ